jgi:hypothetical protein
MGPALQQHANDYAPRGDDDQGKVATGPGTEREATANSPRPRRSRAESVLNERLGRVLSQKKAPDTVLIGVLSVALALGLFGLAFHFLWVVAIVVMALGLGFAIANSRRDRIDVVNQRAEGRSVSARR